MEYYTDPIPSHIVEALELADLSRLEGRVLIHLCRHSYGYGTRAVKVSVKELSDRLGQQQRNINMVLARLEGTDVIKVIERGQGWRVVAVNEAIEQWQIGGITSDLINRPRIRRSKGSPDSESRINLIPLEAPIGSPGSESRINLIRSQDHHDPIASVNPVLHEGITGITSSSSSSVIEFLQSVGLTEEEANRFGQPSDPILQGSLAKARTLHQAINARTEIKYPSVYLRTILNSGKLKGQFATLLESPTSPAGSGGQSIWWQRYNGARSESEASNA